MTPAPRDMPTIAARYDEVRHAWLLALPGGIELPCLDDAAIQEAVRRYAAGAAVRYVRTPPGNSPDTAARAGRA